MATKSIHIPQAGPLKDHIDRIYRVGVDGYDEDKGYLSLPTGSFRLAFNLSKSGVYTSSHAKTLYPNVLLRGAASKSVLVHEVEATEQYSVVFKPHGLSRFTGISVSELADGEFAAEDVFGNEVLEIADRLKENPGSELNFAIIENFLLERFAPADVRMVEQAFRLMRNGDYSVVEMSEMIGCDPKTLRRHFKKFTGIAIKKQMDILRLNRVWKDFTENPSKKNVDVALDNGFTDQAHMNNELKKFTGLTPLQIRKIERASHYEIEDR